jgi:4-hydroxybenzoate polyprenyltransferase
LFNTIGVVISFYVSKRIMLFNFLFSVALWFFSHKLKKKAFLSEVSAALLSLAPFGVVLIYFKAFNFQLFLYLSFMALIILIREILKDLIAQKGDAIYGYETLPIKVGVEASKGTLKLLMLFTLIPFVVIAYMHGVSLIMGYFMLGELVIIGSIGYLNKAESSKDFKQLDTAYKLLMIAGILSIPLV